VDKVFHSLHGLHLHESRNCSAALNYKPKGHYNFTEEEYNTIFKINPTPTTRNETSGCTTKQMAIMEQDVFDIVNENMITDEEECNMNIVDIATEKPIKSETEAISTFTNSQSKLCSYLFGEHFITCRTYEDMISSVQSHYATSESSKILNDTCVYNFYLESGLSRKHGNKLLSVIRSFNPVLPVPRTVKGIETRVKKSMKQHNDCVKLSVPWVEKWKMHELRGFQPIKIYVRNLFQVISHSYRSRAHARMEEPFSV